MNDFLDICAVFVVFAVAMVFMVLTLLADIHRRK